MAESPLDVLRRDVLDVTTVIGLWTAGDRVQLDTLVAMAVRHIVALKRLNFDKLPWWAELFGRAYVTKAATEVIVEVRPTFNTGLGRKPYLKSRDRGGNTKEVSAQMNFGSPLTWTDEIRTWNLPALILFQDGLHAFVPSNVQVTVAVEHENAKHGFVRPGK